MERGNGTPVVLHDLIMWINQVIKDSSFARVKKMFRNYGSKVCAIFRGGERLERQERLKVKSDAF